MRAWFTGYAVYLNSDFNGKFILQSHTVTTNENGTWDFSVPSGYIAVAARPNSYTYGVFLSNNSLRAYDVSLGAPAIARNTEIGAVRILFIKN